MRKHFLVELDYYYYRFKNLKKIIDQFFFPSFAEAKFYVFIHLKFDGEKVDTE